MGDDIQGGGIPPVEPAPDPAPRPEARNDPRRPGAFARSARRIRRWLDPNVALTQADHQPGDLRPLKFIGIGLPITLIVIIEFCRDVFIEDVPLQRAEHVAIAAITIVGVVVFALIMFGLIERAERQIVRQNRELTAINAVSTAVQGELAVEQIIDAALETVTDRTGATEASVVVFPRYGKPESGLERKVIRSRHAPANAIGSDLPHLIDIPLAHGMAVVGRMRLHMPEGTEAPDLLTSATLQNIGHQLASSIQLGQLVSDLQREKLEDTALYDVLIRISNQKPLSDTLNLIVSDARELLAADESVMCLSGITAMLLDASGPNVRLSDGTACISADPNRFSALRERPLACPVGCRSESPSSMHVPLTTPDLNLGELWVARSADSPFSSRDRVFLQTLGELAAIAISGARMLEMERQGAILAERERIAREMHDSLAQVLGVIHLRLRALRSSVDHFDPPVLAAGLLELADVAEDAYRDVRESILGLRESSRAERSLFESLRAYLDKFQRQSGIETRLETDFPVEPRLSPRAEVQIIRVIQEALTNARKHAGATHAVVRVASDDGTVTFRIEDDGRGFDVTNTLLDRDAGFGLHAMRERMELIGGTLTIESARGRGTRLVACVPAIPGSGQLSPEAAGDHGQFESDRDGRLHADPDPARR